MPLLPSEIKNPGHSEFPVFDGCRRTGYPLLIDLFKSLIVEILKGEINSKVDKRQKKLK